MMRNKFNNLFITGSVRIAYIILTLYYIKKSETMNLLISKKNQATFVPKDL